ncbi:hypothetical protein [Thermus sp. FJN-A]
MLVVLMGVLASVPVLGATLPELEGLFEQGKYQEVAQEASKLGGSEALALASKAAAFYAIYQAQGDTEKREWFKRAEELARRAIQLDPKNPRAYMALGRALGRLAEYANLFSQAALANQIRQAFEKAIELDRSYPEPKVGLALWHAQLVAKKLGFVFGARADRVEPLMDEALSLQPNRIIFHVEYARAMVLLGKKDKAKALLEKALSLPVKTAEDKYEQEHARKLLGEL